MKIQLPNGSLDCEYFSTVKSGKFTFVGAKLRNKDRLHLIVVNESDGTVVGTYKTKMKNKESMDLLLNRIIEDRENRIYRSFSVYCSAWVSKTNQLRIPAKLINLITQGDPNE